MDAAKVISALAEPRRREMLRLIREKPRSASDLRNSLSITQQAVSLHLQVLTKARLVQADREGRGKSYTLSTEGLHALDRFLSELWPDGLYRLKAAVEAERDG